MPVGVALYLLYLVLIFSFGDLRLLLTMSWRRDRRRLVQRFMIRQGVRVMRVLPRLTGMEVSADVAVAGPLPPRFIIISNHQSLADIPVLIAAFRRHPLRFIAKDTLKWGIPTISKCLRYGGSAFVAREGAYRSTRRELRRLATDGDSTASMVVFPEGTRSRDGVVGPFHRAGARVLTEHQPLPLVGVALDGGTAIARLGGLRKLARRQYRVQVTSIVPAPADRRQLGAALDQIRAQIVDQLERWRAAATTPGRPAAR